MTHPSSGRSKDHSIHVTNEVVNTVTHLAAACFAILGSTLLIAMAVSNGDIWQIAGFIIYGLSLISLFVFSTLHHSINGSERTNAVLRTFDYISVFLLIAGTVTPLVLVLYRNTFGWAVLGSVWAIAITGIVLRSVFLNLPKYITNTLYIILGWLPVVLVFNTPKLSFGALALLAAGGITYSVGFVIYILERPNPWPGIFGFHEIWHCLVTVAALFHFLLMYFYVL